MFEFIKKVFFAGLTILSSVNPLSTAQLKFVSITNQQYKVRPKIVNVNSVEPVFYPFSIKQVNAVVVVTISYYSYVKMCVPDVLKNLNVKVLNLI